MKSSAPTRVRYGVAGLLVILGMITYIDRACLATLAPAMASDLGLSKVQLGYVFSAFAFAYAIFGIPSAWLADRIGTRAALGGLALLWSFCTLATGWVRPFAGLLAVRFIFGAAEAGAWPAAARTFARWIPRTQRGKAQGAFFAGSHLAGGVTAIFVAALLRHLAWQKIFALFGSAGLVWSLVWYFWFRNTPESHPRTNAAERSLIAGVGSEAPLVAADAQRPAPSAWRLIFNRDVWLVCGLYFPLSTFFYFCITWLPAYLRDGRGLSASAVVMFTALPLVLSAIADLAGGWITDIAVRRLGPRRGHRLVGVSAYSVSTLCLVAAPLVTGGWLAGVLISVGTAASMFTLPAAWSTSTAIGGPHAAVVSAAMNTSGQVGSFLCPLLVAYALKYFASWTLSIEIMAALFALAACCWATVNAPRRETPAPAPLPASR